MVNDPIGDMLIQIKNAGMTGKRVVELPYSRLKYDVAKILVAEGYVVSVEKTGSAPKLSMKITLRYNGNMHVITNVKRKSKPGLRLYVGRHEIPTVVGGMGTSILSTPMGVMTGNDAKHKGIGGELLCEIW